MSELDGQDAFDKLLAALTDAQRDFFNERFLKEQAEQLTRAAQASAKGAIDAQRRAETALKQHTDAALPKLTELHSAAQAALEFMQPSTTKTRLEGAIKEARIYCDEIPF